MGFSLLVGLLTYLINLTRVTSIGSNKFIFLPEPCSTRMETLIQTEIIEIMDTWDLIVKEHCNEDGVWKGANTLTREESLGKKKIQDGIENQRWKLYGTDKSGMLVLDTVDNFNDSMKPFFEDEEETSIQQVHESESLLNNHSQAWVDILGMGKDAGPNQMSRIRKAVVVNKTSVPSANGLRKDHKSDFDPVRGPPCRPLVNGKLGPNAPAANIQTRLLKSVRHGVAQIHDTEVLSSEELQHHIKNFNDGR